MSDPTLLAPQPWLLLVHQLPPKPSYFRVKVWRRLQAMGAVAVKASVYALPASEAAQEDFEWLLREIVDGGGEAMICEARLIDGLTDADIRALFETARAADYEAIADDLRALPPVPAGPGEPASDLRLQLARLRKRLLQVAAIDFFGSPERRKAEDLLAAAELRVRAGVQAPGAPRSPGHAEFCGRTWVTRQGVKVDRVACAWLIGRFIDPEAKFKFVAPKGYVPTAGELRFDMFDAEFTHEGDRCSFEVLLQRMGLDQPGLRAIGEIIHDIDLKDAKFQREETAGVAHLLDGLCRAHARDEDRIARGSALFDDLVSFFGGPEPVAEPQGEGKP
jgi:hypothetical protein